MAVFNRPALRNLFDDSPTPHIAHPPHTHHRDFYLAADGSFRGSGEGGLGVIIETRDGHRIARLSVPDRVPDNNVAEYRALHLGLDVLAANAPPSARVGVLVDHDDLAANVNRATLAGRGSDYRPPHPFRVPGAAAHHWRGIRARINGFDELRAARIRSADNPAHPLANTPEQFAHVNREISHARPDYDDGQVPPPSRANRHAGEQASD